MTGKEHRLPRAVFSPHSSMCQSLSSFSFFFLEKGNRNYWCVLWSCCRTEMSEAGSLTGLFSTVEYQYGSFGGFKCFLVGVIRCKFPLFKPVKVRAKEIWSLLELFIGWLLRVKSETFPQSQLWSVLTADFKKKVTQVYASKRVKSKNKNNWITSYACWLLSRLCMSFQMNGQLLAKIYRKKERGRA